MEQQAQGVRKGVRIRGLGRRGIDRWQDASFRFGERRIDSAILLLLDILPTARLCFVRLLLWDLLLFSSSPPYSRNGDGHNPHHNL
jgi:hypothetical protein